MCVCLRVRVCVCVCEALLTIVPDLQPLALGPHTNWTAQALLSRSFFHQLHLATSAHVFGTLRSDAWAPGRARRAGSDGGGGRGGQRGPSAPRGGPRRGAAPGLHGAPRGVPWEAPVNLALSAPSRAVRMGGAFSFMCALRMDGIGSWSRVFDFSLVADEDSITAGAAGLTRDLHFTVFRGKKPFSVTVSNFFELGEKVTMLCTVSPSGHMRVFKDGALVGENAEGMAPLRQDRPRMIVGGHYMYTDQAFHGSLRNVKMWNLELEWPMLGNAGSSLVPKEGGWFPDDVDTVLLPTRKGKDVSIVGLVESFDGESTDADSLDGESLVPDTGGVFSCPSPSRAGMRSRT
ncbi:unnamed protein product [Prorocentrum cordatum]|uniref:Uncharacterized protein n=2 Tax=Prorocentrum cordatum TaxID=2364126 RepID=A0ABN9VIG8_9DINO|nr:unnamed protein product [Polarella glacialis]